MHFPSDIVLASPSNQVQFKYMHILYILCVFLNTYFYWFFNYILYSFSTFCSPSFMRFFFCAIVALRNLFGFCDFFSVTFLIRYMKYLWRWKETGRICGFLTLRRVVWNYARLYREISSCLKEEIKLFLKVCMCNLINYFSSKSLIYSCRAVFLLLALYPSTLPYPKINCP